MRGGLEGEIARFIMELDALPSDRIPVKRVRARLLAMLRFPRDEETPMDKDRALNDPLDLWGPTPGWRCWVGRHEDCEPLGADESCSCACGIGGHRMDQSDVRTPGCDCGHPGMGEGWHGSDCVWRRTWRQAMRASCRDATRALGLAEEEA